MLSFVLDNHLLHKSALSSSESSVFFICLHANCIVNNDNIHSRRVHVQILLPVG